MVTLIYNISRPEQGGVGRYTYELLRRLKEKIKFNEIDLSPSFGKNNFEKLLAILWKRKRYLFKQKKFFGDVNHFLQTEIYYNIHGKNIVTFHNPPMYTKAIANMYSGRTAFIRSFLFYKRYLDALKTADFFIANSIATKEGIVEMGVDDDKVKIIPLGIDEKFKTLNPWKERNNIIGYIGSFTYHKRIEKLIEDWSKNFNEVNNFSLSLYGSGVKFKELKHIYDNKFNIKILGQLNEDFIAKTMNSFKAFVFPTKGESFGLPIIEAVACGTPVFIYKDAKITMEVKKYCIEMESVSEIPKILERLKEEDLVKKAKKVKKEFDWKKNVEETIEIYKKL